MKKVSQKILTTLLLVAILSGCKKSNNSKPVSTWNYAGASYTGSTTGFINSQTLLSSDTTLHPANNIELFFHTPPVANRTYIVANAFGSLDSTKCAIGLFTSAAGGQSNIIGASIDNPGKTVNITFSGGKLTASFSNIDIQLSATGGGTTASTISGTLVQQ